MRLCPPRRRWNFQCARVDGAKAKKGKTMVRFLVSVLLAACSVSVFALDIVRSGEAKAEIVVAKDCKNANLAAEQLRRIVEKSTGVKLDIVNAPSGKGLNPVYVGASALTDKLGYALPKFPGSGYDILVDADYMVLAGPCFSASIDGVPEGALVSGCSDNGDMHAVSAFLESLGVRFYAPGEKGTVIPALSTIAPPRGRCTRAAAFSRREYFSSFDLDDETRQWFQMLKCGGTGPVLHGHTVAFLMKDGIRQAAWCAESEEGKPFSPPIPRFSEPSFQKACVDFARNFFDRNPEVKQLALGGPIYGGHPLDWRDRKKYQTTGVSDKSAYTNMILDFHKAVAAELKKTHPDRNLIWQDRKSVV